jgi:hypothetical protein
MAPVLGHLRHQPARRIFLHADFVNGWEKSISDAWVAGCVQAGRDCHAHLLGDGRMMY